MIPHQLRQQVVKILGNSLEGTHSVSGGSINEAAKITDTSGNSFFLKWNKSAPPDMFGKEQKGLELLRSARSGLTCPVVVEAGLTAEGVGFILMEFIEKGAGKKDSDYQFGKQLASLHQTMAEQYGLDHDNYIGRLPQSNTKHADWISFFVEERLEPRLKEAVDKGEFYAGIRKNFTRLYKQLPGLLPDEPASLLHGDLWNGNYCYDLEGNPTVYDPAVYFGNREIEIAFTHLFGGFSSGFYRSYQEHYPLESGFNDRIRIYNLYPLLVHTNLFGGSYARQVESVISRF